MTKLNISGQANLDAARVGFHAAFLQQLTGTPKAPIEEAFLEVPSTTSVEEWQWLGDLPGFTEWTGDRQLASMTAYNWRLANKEWSSGFRVHQRNFKDDKVGLFGQAVAGLAIAAREHRGEIMAKLLINGFAGTAYPDLGSGLAYDGSMFFSTARATGSNKITTALDATGAGLDEAELLFDSQTTYDGKRKLRIAPTHLIVGPKLKSVARRLLTVETLAGGASNPYKDRYELIVEPWLTGTYDDYWFLADCSKPWKPCMFQNREEISTSAIMGQQGGDNDSIPRFQRGEYWFGAEAVYNVGYFEPRLIVGAQVA